jgi:acetoin utilization deacetylase AcuC-like enzyme
MWPMVAASNGGAVAAARAAWSGDGVSGSLSSGLHHAQHERGAAFCTFNGLAIAAKTLLAEGAHSVLILDLDAHCGGGTHWLIDGDEQIRQIDVAVNGVDGYMPSGDNTLDIVRVAGDYLPMIEMRLGELPATPDLCIYNAGMDPDERCEIGGLPGIDEAILRKREELVFEWAKSRRIPIAFVLAGGYCGSTLTQDELVDLHRMTIETACRTTM